MLVEIGEPARTGTPRNMSALSPERIMDPEIGIKEKVASWAANQGPTTILLFAIVYCLYAKTGVVIDRTIDRIERGYSKNAADLKIVAEQHDRTIDKVITQWKDDRELLVDVLRGRRPERSETAENK